MSGGASMKDIKLRIKSVESTMQITKAMELVASSKLNKAKLRVERSRPYFTLLHQTLAEIAGVSQDTMRRYLKEFEDEYMVYRGTVQARPPLSGTSQVP